MSKAGFSRAMAFIVFFLSIWSISAFVQNTNPPFSNLKIVFSKPSPALCLFSKNSRRKVPGVVTTSMSAYSKPFIQQLTYQAERLLLRGITTQLLLVSAISLVFIGIGAVFLWICSKGLKPFNEVLIKAYMLLFRVAGCNPMAATSPVEVISANVLFNLHILTIALATGMVSNTAKAAVDRQLAGSSPVYARNHVVLLSEAACDQLSPVISALAAAASGPSWPAGLSKRPVTVLTSQTRAQVAPAIESAARTVAAKGGKELEVIVRTGDVRTIADLDRVSVADAGRVVVLAPDSDRPLLAAGGGKVPPAVARRVDLQTGLVRQLRTAREGGPVGLLALPGAGEMWREYETDFSVVEDQEFVGRLVSAVVQPGQSGLAEVYAGLLQPGGPARLALADAAGLTGRRFEDLSAAFPRASVVGILRGGRVMLAPAPNTLVEAGDSLILVAGQNSADLRPRLGSAKPAAASLPQTPSPPSLGKGVLRRTLVVNWNERGARTLAEMEAAAVSAGINPAARSVTVVTDREESRAAATAAGADVILGNPLSSAALRAAGAAEADVILVLSDSDSASNTNSRTDAELLALLDALARVIPPPPAPGAAAAPPQRRPRVVAAMHEQASEEALRRAGAAAGVHVDLLPGRAMEAGALVQVLLDPKMEAVLAAITSPAAILRVVPAPPAPTPPAVDGAVVLGLLRTPPPRSGLPGPLVLEPRSQWQTAGPGDQLVLLASVSPA